jgi:hypothetical protein
MRKNNPFRLVSCVLVLALMLPSGALWAQDEDQRLSGRVFDADKKTAVADAAVEIVSAETGQSRGAKTNANGCFDFENVPVGTYTLSVNQAGTSFFLANKIKVDPKVKLMACVSLAQNNSLEIVTESCNCREFPWLVLVLGTGPAAGFILAGEDDPDEASPSRP